MARTLTDADIGYLSDQYNRLRDEGWPAERAAAEVDAMVLTMIGARKERRGGQGEREYIANRHQR